MLVLLMAALVWSRTLRRQVNARTRDLRESEAEARALERRLLQARKMESLGRLAGEPQNVSWNDVVGDTREMLQRLIGSRIGVHFDAQPGLWPVWLDPGQALQIVMNLVINARDAMPGPGTIAIEAANVVVEDDEGVRELAGILFRSLGHEVLEAADGESALCLHSAAAHRREESDPGGEHHDLTGLRNRDRGARHRVGRRHAGIEPCLQHVHAFVCEKRDAAVVREIEELDVLPAGGLIEEIHLASDCTRRRVQSHRVPVFVRPTCTRVPVLVFGNGQSIPRSGIVVAHAPGGDAVVLDHLVVQDEVEGLIRRYRQARL
jgi:hypothetical protein